MSKPTTANSGLTFAKLLKAKAIMDKSRDPESFVFGIKNEAVKAILRRSLRARLAWVRRKNKGRMTATEIDLGNKLCLLG